MNHKLFFLMLLASVAFSLNPILAKTISDEFSYSGTLIIRLGFVIFLLPLITMILTEHHYKTFFQITKRGALEFFALGFFFAGNILLFYFSFNYIDINRALFISFTFPVFTVLFARLFLKEKATPEEIMAVALTIIGSITMFWGTDLSGGTIIGDIMVGISVLFWSAYVVLNRYTALREVHYRQTFWVFLFAALLIFPFFRFYDYSNPLELSGNAIKILLIIGLFCTLLPYSIMNYCSKHLRSTVIGLFVLLSMVLTIFISIIFLGEKAEPNVVMGGVLIIVASVISIMEFRSVFLLNHHIKLKIKESKLISIVKKIFKGKDLVN